MLFWLKPLLVKRLTYAECETIDMKYMSVYFLVRCVIFKIPCENGWQDDILPLNCRLEAKTQKNGCKNMIQEIGIFHSELVNPNAYLVHFFVKCL